MSIDYDKTTAFHYAAYRPLLHEPILLSCLGERKFKHGLDIGCGTGVSSVALKKFCNDVTGVDPSKKMLSQTITDKHIDYHLLKDKNLPFPDHTFDICTYAGAWWYGKSQALLDETIRVCVTDGIILLYDFELDLQKIYDSLALMPADLRGYDHHSNFEKLDTSAIRSTSKQIEKKSLILSPTKIAHLLCSEKPIYDQLVLKFSNTDTFDHLVQHIKNCFGQSNIPVTAVTYYTMYRL